MFRTVSRKKETKFTVGNLLLLLMGLTILSVIVVLIFTLLPPFFRIKDQLLESTFTLNMILVALIVLSAINYILFRNNKGKIAGTLDFQNDKIMIDEKEFALSEIEKIRIIGNDIKGEFRGAMSKGAGNQLIITMKNGEKTDVYFEQTTENKLKNQKDILNVYHDEGKLSESNYQNILNNTNYY